MPNTYTQIYIHIVFTVKGRLNLIPEQYCDDLYKYITGIIQNRQNKLLAIGGMPDHVHVFIGIFPGQSISDLVRDIKAFSSKHINENKWVNGKFEWQTGYGAFSYSHSHIDSVCKYILNQEHHHKKRTFKEEYLELLEKFQIQYDEKYLFEWVSE